MTNVVRHPTAPDRHVKQPPRSLDQMKRAAAAGEIVFLRTPPEPSPAETAKEIDRRIFEEGGLTRSATLLIVSMMLASMNEKARARLRKTVAGMGAHFDSPEGKAATLYLTGCLKAIK